MWLEAITSVSSVINRVLARVWGTRTQEEDTAEKEAARAEAEFAQALARGDARAATGVYQHLVRLRDRARARRAGR